MESQKPQTNPANTWADLVADLQEMRDALLEASLALRDYEFLLESSRKVKATETTDELMKRINPK